MFSQATSDGTMTLTVTFRLGTDADKAQVLVQNRVTQALPRLPQEVTRARRHHRKSSPDLTMVVHLISPDDRYDMLYLRNYALLQRQGPARHDRTASATCSCFGSRRLRDARLARPGEGRRARPDRQRRRGRDPRAERAGRRRRHRRARPTANGVELPAHRSTPRAAADEEEFGDIIVKRGATAPSRACATSRASSSALRRLCAALAARQPHGGGHSDLPARPAPTPSRSPTRSAPRWRS